jgi:hypothetical protein
MVPAVEQQRVVVVIELRMLVLDLRRVVRVGGVGMPRQVRRGFRVLSAGDWPGLYLQDGIEEVSEAEKQHGVFLPYFFRLSMKLLAWGASFFARYSTFRYSRISLLNWLQSAMKSSRLLKKWWE